MRAVVSPGEKISPTRNSRPRGGDFSAERPMSPRAELQPPAIAPSWSRRLVGCALAASILSPATAAASDPASELELEGPALAPAIPSPYAMQLPADDFVAAHDAWAKKRRRLQIQTGISGSLVAAFLVGIPTALFLPSTCRDPDPDFGCGEGYGRVYGSIMLAAAAVVTVIPTIVYGVRLDRHWLDRPVPRRVALAPGGLTLRF